MGDTVEISAEELRARALRASAALKVFPLPGVVLFPGIPSPFHIFEPRYRALVRDALASDRILAIGTLVDPAQAGEARPELYPVACACYIEAHQQHADGRYDIVVRGAARVRLLSELERPRPYREFRSEVLEDELAAEEPAAIVSRAEALEQCVYELTGLLPPESGAEQLAEAAARERSPAALADLVAAAVVSEQDARLEMLSELDVGKRLERVTAEVAGVILMLSRGKSPTV